MKTWKLIAHHEDPAGAAEWSRERGVVSVGWAGVGDLKEMNPKNFKAIGREISARYPDLKNSATGGPSLWNFFARMNPGDLVLVAGGKRHYVAEVEGPYFLASKADSFSGYCHQRKAKVTEINPDNLWDSFGGSVAEGQSTRWTVALCKNQDGESASIPGYRERYLEGTKHEVLSRIPARSRKAREACLAHFGVKCVACSLDFVAEYGQELGLGNIHVHHLQPMYALEGEREIDPIVDLVPLCPNCHSLAHRKRPPLTIHAIQALLRGE